MHRTCSISPKEAPPVSHPRREVFAVFSMLNSTGTLPVLEPQLLAAQGTITAGGFEYLAASPVIQSPMSWFTPPL